MRALPSGDWPAGSVDVDEEGEERADWRAVAWGRRKYSLAIRVERMVEAKASGEIACEDVRKCQGRTGWGLPPAAKDHLLTLIAFRSASVSATTLSSAAPSFGSLQT